MVNYGNTKIYKIWSPLGDDIYIGSTTKQYLCQRMVRHRYTYKMYLENGIKYCSSILIFEKYGVDNCMIELIEAKDCNSKDEQLKLEGKYIRELNCVNLKIAGRTKKEWYDDNKEIENDKCKEYYKENKEKIQKQQSEKCFCQCGNYYTKSNKIRHEKSIRHLKLLNVVTQ
jgi:hypothetical protein